MASLRTSTPKARGLARGTAKGFTLMEMLIVMGIVLVIASAPLFIDLTNFRMDAFRAERSAIVSILQKARADALNNINQEPHGVAFFPADHPQSYVVFEGASYAASDPAKREVTNMNYPITFGATSPTEIVFSQLDAATGFTGDIVLNDPQRGASVAITVNREGAISW